MGLLLGQTQIEWKYLVLGMHKMLEVRRLMLVLLSGVDHQVVHYLGLHARVCNAVCCEFLSHL